MEPTAIQTGTVIDRYTVESVIGEGGMAVVFRVRHNTLGTLHALKVLTLTSRLIRERLRQEGQAQAKLQHPNVVAVTDVIDLGGTDALIMEYVDGPTLEALMREKRLTLAQADELAVGILAGVGEAHRLGYVHRDLKPGNVLLKVTGRGYLPKVADFGLAKAFGEGSDPGRAQTRTGSTMGTPHYMSPEQVRDAKNVGPRSDIFSLGAVLYEMVAGRRAFEGLDLLEIFNAVANGSCAPIRSLVPEVPVRMEQAIQAAMQTDLRDRPETVEALATIWRGTNGNTLAPSSAFDLPVLSATSMAPFPARGSETWAAAETLPDSVAPLSSQAPLSTLSQTLPTTRVAWVLGLGGGVMIAAVVGLLLVGGLAVGGAWWWSQRESTPVAELKVPALEKTEAPSPSSSSDEEEEATVEAEPTPPVVPGVRTGVKPAAPPASPDDAVVVAEVPVAPEPPQAVLSPSPEPAAEARPAATRVDPMASGEGPELIGMQASDDPEDRLKSVANLAKRPDDDALRLLDHFVRADLDPVVRRAAWTVVFDRYNKRYGDVGLLEETVVWQMAHGNSRDAIEALESFGRYGTQPQLLDGPIRHPSADVRGLVTTAVREVAGRANEGVDYDGLLAPLLDDVDAAVRRKATAALAELP